MSADVVRVRIAPVGVLGQNVDPDSGDANDWRFLRRPALLGFLALVSVAVGVSLDSSPFKLEMPGTWFFGEPAQPGVTIERRSCCSAWWPSTAVWSC